MVNAIDKEQYLYEQATDVRHQSLFKRISNIEQGILNYEV